jgi:hypothetical protein
MPLVLMGMFGAKNRPRRRSFLLTSMSSINRWDG